MLFISGIYALLLYFAYFVWTFFEARLLLGTSEKFYMDTSRNLGEKIKNVEVCEVIF